MPLQVGSISCNTFERQQVPVPTFLVPVGVTTLGQSSVIFLDYLAMCPGSLSLSLSLPVSVPLSLPSSPKAEGLQ